jgi:hypothetical protein
MGDLCEEEICFQDWLRILERVLQSFAVRMLWRNLYRGTVREQLRLRQLR